MPRRPLLPALGFVTVALFAQCAGAPLAPQAAPLADGERVEVVYRDSGTTLSLRNESSLAAEAAYSAPDGDQNLKIAKDADLEQLLADWSRAGFFTAAGEGAVHPQAKASLIVQRNGRTWVWSRLPLAMTTTTQIQDFQACASLFRGVYDYTQAFHTASGMGRSDFEQESRRLRERNREALERGKQ